MQPGLLMSDNTLSLNRARTISLRPAVIYARHYGRRVRERRGSRTAPSPCTRQWLANETIRPMHHRDSPPSSLSFSPCSYRSLARDPRLCLFPDTPFHDLSPPPLAGSMCLCPLMANSSSLTAHNFLDAITKDGIRDRDAGEKRRCLVRAQSSELLTSIFFKFLHDGCTETIG